MSNSCLNIKMIGWWGCKLDFSYTWVDLLRRWSSCWYPALGDINVYLSTQSDKAPRVVGFIIGYSIHTFSLHPLPIFFLLYWNSINIQSLIIPERVSDNLKPKKSPIFVQKLDSDQTYLKHLRSVKFNPPWFVECRKWVTLISDFWCFFVSDFHS